MTRRKKSPPDAVDLDKIQDHPAPQGSFNAWCDTQDTTWDKTMLVLDEDEQ